MSIIPPISPTYERWVKLSEEDKIKILKYLKYTDEQIEKMSDKDKWNAFYRTTKEYMLSCYSIIH